MINIMRTVAFLLVILILACDSSSSKSICSFKYIGTLGDGGTVKMAIDVECPSKDDVAKIEKNITIIKRALSMTLVQQKTESLHDSGKYKIQNSLYKIIAQFSKASFEKIRIYEFKVY